MSVGNVQCRHSLELFGYAFYILIIIYYPKLMTETIVGSHEVVNRLFGGILPYNFVE